MGEMLLNRIRYRGPDDEGVATMQGNGLNGVLVHTRLSIIGLGLEGHQPMKSSNGSFVLSFNGEIFNYRELQQHYQLPVTTKTDTEVLLLMWERMGVNCLPLLDGFFAFAIWDTDRNECFLVRDKTGVKPLYWYQNNQGDCVFSSDERTLIPPAVNGATSTNIKKDANKIQQKNAQNGNWLLDSYVSQFLVGQSDAQSPYLSVSEVPAAGYLRIKPPLPNNSELLGRHQLTVETMAWTDSRQLLSLNLLKQKTEESWKSMVSVGWGMNPLDSSLDKLPRVSAKAELLRKQLFMSISRRLQSDVPVGFALSGGLDSSAIAAVAKWISLNSGNQGDDQPLITFSIASSQFDEDESKWQQKMVEFLGTQHRSLDTSEFSYQSLPSFVKHTGRPALHWNNLAHYEMCKLVKQSGVTVLFNGQGADEIFAGYPNYYVHQIFREWTSLIPHRDKWPIGPNEALKQAFKKKLKSWLGKDIDSDKQLYQKLEEDYFGSRLRQLLRFEDRNGMANQLEARNPFADDPLLSNWIGISALEEDFEENNGFLIGELSSRLYHGYSKGLLRESMIGILPKEILERSDKKGFSVPHLSLTQKHYKNWEEAILGVDYLNRWWSYQDRKQRFREGKDASWLFQCASLGYFVNYLESEFGMGKESFHP